MIYYSFAFHINFLVKKEIKNDDYMSYSMHPNFLENGFFSKSMAGQQAQPVIFCSNSAVLFFL